jgi:yeast amino acid transporter
VYTYPVHVTQVFADRMLQSSDIPLVITAYLIWKFVKRTRIVSLKEIPLQEALEEIRIHPEDPEPENTGWRKFVTFLWD